MSLLTLDSSSLSNQLGHDFTVTFPNPINVREGYELALIKSNLWYSFYNVSSTFNNNVIIYTNDTLDVRTVTFPNGNYTIIQLNSYLHSVMKNNNDYTVISGIDTFNINFTPNYSTIKVTIELTNTYSLDLTQSKFNELLGWNQGIYNFTGYQDGQNTADITRGINSILIHCDIINQSYQNSISSDVLYSFVPNQPVGSNIEVEPTHLIYLPIRYNDLVHKIRMYITDQLNRPIDFNGEPITYLLHIRKQSNIFNPTTQNI